MLKICACHDPCIALVKKSLRCLHCGHWRRNCSSCQQPFRWMQLGKREEAYQCKECSALRIGAVVQIISDGVYEKQIGKITKIIPIFEEHFPNLIVKFPSDDFAVFAFDQVRQIR
jgi:hypothetical protein